MSILLKYTHLKYALHNLARFAILRKVTMGRVRVDIDADNFSRIDVISKLNYSKDQKCAPIIEEH